MGKDQKLKYLKRRLKKNDLISKTRQGNLEQLQNRLIFGEG